MSSRSRGKLRGLVNVLLYLVIVPAAYSLAMTINDAPVVNWLYWFYGYAFGFFSWIWGLILVPTLLGVDRIMRSGTVSKPRWSIVGTAALLNTIFGGYVLRSSVAAVVLGASGLLYGWLFRIRERP